MSAGEWQYPFAQSGWMCPLCRRVYSPSTTECYHCNTRMQRATNDTGTAPTVPPTTIGEG